MNTISSTQNTIDLYAKIAQVKAEQDTNDELQAKTNLHKKQVQDSVEISQQALNNPFANVLDSLVTAGTITSDQETSIVSAFQAGKSVQNTGTYNTTGTYNSKKINPLDSLVSSGTITEDQANSIKSAFEALGKPEKPKPEEGSNPMQDLLDNLVSAGTITSDQEASIQSALEASMQSKPSKPEEGSNPMQDLLDSLAASETITAAQQEAIQNAFEAERGED